MDLSFKNPGPTGIYPLNLVVPPARNEEESASMRQVLSETLNNGKILRDPESHIYAALVNSDDLRRLGYRPFTQQEMENSMRTVTVLSTSPSAAFLGRLTLDVMEDVRFPGSIDWSERINDFSLAWPNMKSDFRDNDPTVRSAARLAARAVLNPIRLRGKADRLRIAPDGLRNEVCLLIQRSCLRDHIEFSRFMNNVL